MELALNETACKTTLPTLTDELGFSLIGAWRLASCGLKLECPPQEGEANKAPSVYLIAAVADGGGASVLYVGKAGDGWQGRRRQHLGHSDRPFHAVIARELGKGCRVVILERVSGYETYFGYRASTNDAEETALQARFCPPINGPRSVLRALRHQLES